jgi:hypothetical protein
MNSVIELPFNQHVGLQIADDLTKVLQLPAGAQYLNHLGTVHASAQLALAEASSGEFLLRAIGDLAGIVPVVRRLESKFRKPANGRLTSTASTADGIESLRNELEAKGRALITVQVELHDETGAHTLPPRWNGLSPASHPEPSNDLHEKDQYPHPRRTHLDLAEGEIRRCWQRSVRSARP